jgi:hypothetical protein
VQATQLGRDRAATFPSGSQSRLRCAVGIPTLNDVSLLLPEIEELMKSKTSPDALRSYAKSRKN